jgi:2-phospho-L-lactate guanylyltransferase
MPRVSGDGDQWSVIVPVKLLDVAKSRLQVATGVRTELALAMACDAVSAVLASARVGEVVIVTDDERAGTALAARGARVVADGPTAGLNPAVLHGASAAVHGHVAAMTSDLPALLTTHLDDVLAVASGLPLTVVADAAGTGTTLLTAAAAGLLTPRFGIGSWSAHTAVGAVDLTATAGPTLRHDVDTLDALHAARRLGVGPETLRVMHEYAL